MLKLEKASRGKEVIVTVRGKEPFWNRAFLVALGCALALHGIGVLFFKVAPLKMQWHHSSHTPSIVRAYFPHDATTIALVDAEDLPSRYVPAPALTTVVIPSIPFATSRDSLEVFAENNQVFPFALVEKQLLDTFSEKRPASKPPVSIQFFGGLAQQKVVQDELASWRPPATRSLKGAYRVELNVQVDAQTGTIFWQNVLQSSGIPLLDREAMTLLNEVKLTLKRQDEPFVRGTAEITFFFGETS